MSHDLSAQQVFDQAVTQLRLMKGKASSSGDRYDTCLYRGSPNGPCVVGAFIRDDEYTSEMDEDGDGDSQSVDALANLDLLPKRLVPHVALLMSLQSCHDSSMNWGNSGFNEHGEENLRNIAFRHSVAYTPRAA